MNFTMPDFLPALPEILILTLACVVLLVEAATKSRSAGYLLTLFGLLASLALIVLTASGTTTYTFNGMFVDDAMADVLKLMTGFSAIIAVIYSRQYLADREMLRGEYFALVLFAVLGMMVMISASHFLTLYLGLELLSLSLYAMVALQRDSARASEAAMKYFVLGALASGLLLYGMSMLYGLSGSLELYKVAEAIQQGSAENGKVLAFGLVFVVAGLGFKLGAAPFHMWVPDVYHGAPTAVTLFIGSVPKLAAFAFAMRLLVDGMQPAVGDWQQMLVVMAILSLAIGNLAAIMQSNIKRMLAYSTISHMGFVLLGILSGSLAGYAGSMFYVVTYVLMSLGAFGILIYLSRADFEAENLDDFKGLNARKPWLAAMLGIMMLSMAGLPPFVGFYAKLTILQALVGANMLWLALVAVMFSLVGAYYYLRIVKLMYFDAPAADAPAIVAQDDARLLLTFNGLAVLLLGILPQPLLTMCAYSMQLSLQ
jgi:NADH-quinone oxidoreductase subunit N